jgi:LPS-assembly protein
MNSTTLGWGAEVPYYFALDPTYDFTFHPRYLSKEGVLWQGDWRQRLANGEYYIDIAAINPTSNDPIANDLGGWRGSVQTKGQISLSSWWRAGWDLSVDSDAGFRSFYQLNPYLLTDRVNVAYLQGLSDRNYFSAKLYEFGGLLLSNATIDPTTGAVVNTPIAESIVPVIDYNRIVDGPVLGGELSFSANARTLWRNTNGPDSTHVVAEMDWRRKIIDPLGEVWTPFFNLRGDIYNYNNALDPVTLKPLPDATALYGMGAAGLTYSYPFVAHADYGSHIIEPIAQIVARENTPVNQQLLPDEDAKSLVFDDTLLFDTNKFSGFDRFDTGTRLNTGVQYTLQGNNGFNTRVVLGESYQLAGPNAFANPGLDFEGNFNFNPQNGLQTNNSDYVAGVYVSPFSGLSLMSQARFSNANWALEREDSMLSGSYGPLFGSLAYAYTTYDPTLGILTPEQDVLGSLGVKITKNWSLAGSARYNITDNQAIQDQLQLKYADECFVLTASYTETFVTNAVLNIVPDRTVMVRFELKHLGDFNYRTNALNSVFGDQTQGPKL